MGDVTFQTYYGFKARSSEMFGHFYLHIYCLSYKRVTKFTIQSIAKKMRVLTGLGDMQWWRFIYMHRLQSVSFVVKLALEKRLKTHLSRYLLSLM